MTRDEWEYITKLNPWKLQQKMDKIVAKGSRTNPAGRSLTRELVGLIKTLDGVICDYPSFRVFAAQWRYLRLVVPLQVRLLIEQLLYEKGEPWRSLVRGFKPIDLGSVARGSTGSQGDSDLDRKPQRSFQVARTAHKRKRVVGYRSGEVAKEL